MLTRAISTSRGNEMRSLVALLLGMAFVSGSLAGDNVRSAGYRYKFAYNAFSGDSLLGSYPDRLLLDRDGKHLFFADGLYDLKVCDDSSFICRSSDPFLIMLPRTRLETGARWARHNWEFVIGPEIELATLGRKIKARAISAVSSRKDRVDYLYSCRFGVVGVIIFSRSREYSNSYLLANERGFGATC